MLPNVAKKGDWVQVQVRILEPNERAPQVPEDTKKVPLEMRVKGFLIDEKAEIGNTVNIKTPTGRIVSGTLVAINPKYEHDFGEPVPELITIGMELREFLESDEHSGGEKK
ncbi:MAG: 2-amino-4-oxopentanoate thiolase subunit OrtA [Fervidobacterium sp.]|uniref:2-amino-4-oxopentanoate thiolase subunit OrtA n=1 Tax=Fervidobacterium sp. TaxID=1871331 RepID=UPI00404B7E28